MKDTMEKDAVIEVLTPLAAQVLFGRSSEAVRAASRKGHVLSPFSLWFDANEIRLLDLSSATAYWRRQATDRRPKHFAAELVDMRFHGRHVTVELDGCTYRILQAGQDLVEPSFRAEGHYMQEGDRT